MSTIPLNLLLPGITIDALAAVAAATTMTTISLLLMNGFFVTAVQLPLVAAKRVKLTETRAYPRNAGLTVDYQLNSLGIL